jgi:hypothetical protein
MSRAQALSVGVLVVLAAGIGLIWGLRSLPPGETEIIERMAARYVAETGGAPTDCAARPAAAPAVRLVVICDAGAGAPAWAVAVDRMGRALPPEAALPDGGGPRT